MQYRQLGRTGLKVSQLGFGAMRLPMVGEGKDARVDRDLAIPMIHRAFEGGVNYIDTAVMYCNDDSQKAVGEALKGWRDRVIVSTKNHYYEDDEKAWWKLLEDSLRLLDVEYIDIYNHHGISWQRWSEAIEPRLIRWMTKAKDQGLIKHICASFHDDAEGLKKIVATGYVSAITLQYNMLDQALAEGIELAHKAGMGVIVMGPVGGGYLAGDSEVLARIVPQVKDAAELALRFVLANPNVTMALSGMSTMAQVEQNVAIADVKIALSDEEKAAVDQYLGELKHMSELYCTGCDYCLPCPKGVAISKIFSRYNRGRVYGLWDAAKALYARLGQGWDKGSRADECVSCGQCEPKCPQKISIRKQLKEAHAALK